MLFFLRVLVCLCLDVVHAAVMLAVREISGPGTQGGHFGLQPLLQPFIVLRHSPTSWQPMHFCIVFRGLETRVLLPVSVGAHPATSARHPAA